jgi:hypothetical protein
LADAFIGGYRMSIESSLREALEQLQVEKFEAAMTSACISLDATAKHEFGSSSKRRCRQFIQSQLDIISYVATGGAILSVPGSTLNLKRPESPSSPSSFEDIIYESIRCHLVHEASLPANVRFTKEAFYGERDGVFFVPVLMIYAIILSVIAAPTNSNKSLGTDIVMTIFGRQFRLKELWGKPGVLRHQLGIAPEQLDLTL